MSPCRYGAERDDPDLPRGDGPDLPRGGGPDGLAMTDKRYLRDPICDGHMTVEALIPGAAPIARFASTYFHPRGGGQRADEGSIAGIAVIGVDHAGDDMVDHHMATLDGLHIGDAYPFRVDRAKRNRHARYHSAGHLVAAVCESVFDGLTATKGHHWPGEANVEFRGDRLERVGIAIGTVEGCLADAITAALEVVALDGPDGIRTVRIGSYPPIACGGTHVDTSDELGRIAIRSVKIRKGLLRLGYDLE